MYLEYRSDISSDDNGGLRCQSSSFSVFGGVSTMDCSRSSSSVSCSSLILTKSISRWYLSLSSLTFLWCSMLVISGILVQEYLIALHGYFTTGIDCVIALCYNVGITTNNHVKAI
jgi:hypothetical protein